MKLFTPWAPVNTQQPRNPSRKQFTTAMSDYDSRDYDDRRRRHRPRVVRRGEAGHSQYNPRDGGRRDYDLDYDRDVHIPRPRSRSRSRSRSVERRPDGSKRFRSRVRDGDRLQVKVRTRSPSGRVHTHTSTRTRPVRPTAVETAQVVVPITVVFPRSPPPRARPETPSTGTPEAVSQRRMKRAEAEALRSLQDMHHAAARGDPLSSPVVVKTLSSLDAATQLRNVHSHRYFGTPDDGHRYQIELLDRTLAETVHFFTGCSTALKSTEKALRKHTAPTSPAPLPPPGMGVPQATLITPDRVPRVLVFGEHGSS
jgi:hypothetical protein